MIEDIEQAIELHKRLDAILKVLHEHHYKITPKIKGRAYSPKEMVDLGYVQRRLADMADEIRKETNARSVLLGQIVAMDKAKEALADDTVETTVRGELAIGMPEVTFRPKLPKRGSDDYKKLMSFFKVSPEAIERGLLDVNYPRMGIFVSDLAEEGKPFPEGLIGTTPDPKTTFRKKKESPI